MRTSFISFKMRPCLTSLEQTNVHSHYIKSKRNGVFTMAKMRRLEGSCETRVTSQDLPQTSFVSEPRAKHRSLSDITALPALSKRRPYPCWFNGDFPSSSCTQSRNSLAFNASTSSTTEVLSSTGLVRQYDDLGTQITLATMVSFVVQVPAADGSTLNSD